MKYGFRIIDAGQLSGFRQYLSESMAAAVEGGDDNTFAVGVTLGRNAVGAAGVIMDNDGGTLDCFYIDECVRGQGAGSFLLDVLLEILSNMKAKIVSADFVMSGDDAEKFCRMLSRRGFEEPLLRSEIYKVSASAFSEINDIERKYAAAHRKNVFAEPFSALSAEQKKALEQDDEIPDILSWRLLKDEADEGLSAAGVNADGRVSMYVLAKQTGKDFPILSAYAMPNSSPFQFYCVFTRFLKCCRERCGGDDFNVCWSAVAESTERLAARLPQDKIIRFEEYITYKQFD